MGLLFWMTKPMSFWVEKRNGCGLVTIGSSCGLSEDVAATQGNGRGASFGLSELMRDQSWGLDLLGFGVEIGGYRTYDSGLFSEVNSGAFWAIDGNTFYYRELYEDWDGVARMTIELREGFSVRCIQNAE